MFHFPRCPPVRLFIHLTVTGFYSGRVSPFGYSGLSACLRLPRTFRSWLRPSSAISALASTLCSFLLDRSLGLTQSPFGASLGSRRPFSNACRRVWVDFRGYLQAFLILASSFPVQFSRCVRGVSPSGASAPFGSLIPQNDTVNDFCFDSLFDLAFPPFLSLSVSQALASETVRPRI